MSGGFMHNAFRDLDKISRDIASSMSVYNDFASQLQKSTSVIASLEDSLSKHLELDRNLFRTAGSVLSQVRLVELTTSNFRDLSLANQRLTELVSNAAISDSVLSKG
jgi:ABC-type molybdenum transport system ATPase subunit/photorepair protein PhrA